MLLINNKLISGLWLLSALKVLYVLTNLHMYVYVIWETSPLKCWVCFHNSIYTLMYSSINCLSVKFTILWILSNLLFGRWPFIILVIKRILTIILKSLRKIYNLKKLNFKRWIIHISLPLLYLSSYLSFLDTYIC